MSTQSERAIDGYGKIAHLDLNTTARAGRYSFQEAQMRRILPEILPKLQLEPQHEVLEIGCGTGMLLIPMSFLVARVVGLDHPKVVEELAGRLPGNDITLVGGAFPDTTVEGKFDRVVTYSVIQCLPSFEDAKVFARAAAGYLKPGGRLLIGDVASADKKKRFAASDFGKQFEQDWARLRAESGELKEAELEAQKILASSSVLGGMTDAQIMELILDLRGEGYEAYLLPQDPELPFGRTREDILVIKY